MNNILFYDPSKGLSVFFKNLFFDSFNIISIRKFINFPFEFKSEYGADLEFDCAIIFVIEDEDIAVLNWMIDYDIKKIFLLSSNKSILSFCVNNPKIEIINIEFSKKQIVDYVVSYMSKYIALSAS